MTASSGQQQQEVLDGMRDRLQARARELGSEMQAADATRREAGDASPQDDVLDSGDQGEQRTRQMVLDAEQSRDADELAQVDAALGRIADGSYGTCVDCDVRIPLARLQVQPTAARCIDCQERFEKDLAQHAPAHPIG